MNASRIMISSMTNRHDEPGGGANSDSWETEGTDSYAGMLLLKINLDKHSIKQSCEVEKNHLNCSFLAVFPL